MTVQIKIKNTFVSKNIKNSNFRTKSRKEKNKLASRACRFDLFVNVFYPVEALTINRHKYHSH